MKLPFVQVSSSFPLFRALESSRSLRFVRLIAGESRVCGIVRHIPDHRRGLIEALGGRWSREREAQSARQLSSLAAGSQFIIVGQWFTFLSRQFDASLVARVIRGFASLDGSIRVQLVGLMVLVAVLVHIATLVMVGVPVQGVGWTVRGALIGGGIAMTRTPAALASAFRSRPDRSGPTSAP